MKSVQRQLGVQLSRLVPSRRNPRKVRPSRQSHESLVALIRAYGLLQPLVVRPLEGSGKRFEVVAGHRRLTALREIHKGDGDPKIPCILHDFDGVTADAVSLGENFAREAMHPLDEAEAFAKLAAEQAKGVEAIAADFGVSERYVKQRMKLAGLAQVVKAAYRAGEIDTATAEAFAAVPADRQLQVWQEVSGHPRHAEHVRDLIANDWIDAANALFDPSSLPEPAVSRDLFSERVLIERKAYMEAQAAALLSERQKLVEEGWADVVVQSRADIQDRLLSMTEAPPEFDEQTTAKLGKLAEKRRKLEEKVKGLDESDQDAFDALQLKHEALVEEEETLSKDAEVHYSETTKAVGTAFLMLDADGRVRREYRIPRTRGRTSGEGSGSAAGGLGADGSTETPKPPTLDDLRDSQFATTFTHRALAVRQALLKNAPARKRILALILHDRVRSEALSIRHDANGTTVHADQTQGFTSTALDTVRRRRKELDPLVGKNYVEDHAAYVALQGLSNKKLDGLIDVLTVECIAAHLHRQTELVHCLSNELKVNVRNFWRPDAAWLSSFQKIQLALLITDLKGPAHAPAPERKKSELVELLTKLFTDAAEGKLEDKQLADRVNRWLPSNLKEGNDAAEQRQTATIKRS